MECYEGTLYDINDNSLISKIIESEDNDCIYSMPLIMLFFHELFGHAKHRLDNNYSLSPSHYYNPYDNYKLCHHCKYGESGRLFEYYFSNDINIIHYLKFGFFPNKELMNVKLWTASDLSELRQIDRKKIKYNNFKSEKIINCFPNHQVSEYREENESYFSIDEIE
jgi:hypothetical protein